MIHPNTSHLPSGTPLLPSPSHLHQRVNRIIIIPFASVRLLCPFHLPDVSLPPIRHRGNAAPLVPLPVKAKAFVPAWHLPPPIDLLLPQRLQRHHTAVLPAQADALHVGGIVVWTGKDREWVGGW